MSCLVNYIVDVFANETKIPNLGLPNDSGQFGDLYLDQEKTAASLRNKAIVAGCIAVAAASVTLAVGAFVFGAPLAALTTLGALTITLFIGAAVITALSFAALALFLLARHQVNNTQDKHRGEYLEWKNDVAIRLPAGMTADQYKKLTSVQQVAQLTLL